MKLLSFVRHSINQSIKSPAVKLTNYATGRCCIYNRRVRASNSNIEPQICFYVDRTRPLNFLARTLSFKRAFEAQKRRFRFFVVSGTFKRKV